MTKYTVFGGCAQRESGIFNSNTTLYRLPSTGDGRNEVTTEAWRKRPIFTAGQLSKLFANVTVNAHTSTLTYRVRIAGANGNQVLSIGATTTGQFSDPSNTDTLTSDQDLDFAQTIGASDAFHNFTIAAFGIVLDGTSEVAMYHGSTSDAGALGASSTAYGMFCMSGSSSPGWFGQSTEGAQLKQTVRAASVFQKLRTYVSANTSTNASTLTLRKSGADGNNTLSVGASATGAFTDASSTDSFTASDSFDWKWSTGAGTSNAKPEWFGVAQKSNGTTWDTYAGQSETGATNALSIIADNFLNIIGVFAQAFETTESRAQTAWPVAATFSKARIYMASAGSGTQTLTVRIGAANGNQAVSVTSATTGLFEDATHSDTVTAGALVNYKITHATSGIAVPSYAAMLVDAGAGTPVTGNADIGTVTLTAPDVEVHLAKTAASDIGTITLSAPTVEHGLTASAAIGTIVLHAPHARAFIEDGDATARVTQAVRLVATQGNPAARTTQAVRLVAGEIHADARVTQAVRITVAGAVPCVTYWCQCWKITRRDGTVFLFTSLDEDFQWGAELYKSCRSLDPSASQSSTDLGAAGSIELRGIISDRSITEADIYGGRFDDAYVEVWLVPYQGSDYPKRIAAGWAGNLGHGEQGFTLDVTGPGARLSQKPLVQPYTPSCRWNFGSPQCGVDAEAIKATGEVTGARGRGALEGTMTSVASGDVQWVNAKLRWTSGRNDGTECEIKTVVFASGDDGVSIVLWALCESVPSAGDTFDLVPGCDFIRDGGCTLYANVINFGGYPDVPGNDSINETPDA